MSKRAATFQISDRNPVDPSEDEDNNLNYSGSESDKRSSQQEIRQRKISKPRSQINRDGQNKAAPSLGNLFAGLPTNPFAFGNQKATAADESSKDRESEDEEHALGLKMRGLNKSFVQSAQKLYERSPEADFSKLFQQYSKHLASFSYANVPVEIAKPPVAKAEISKPSVANVEIPKPTVANVEISKPPVAKVEISKPFEAKTESSFGVFNVKDLLPKKAEVEPSKSESSESSASEAEAAVTDRPSFSFVQSENLIKIAVKPVTIAENASTFVFPTANPTPSFTFGASTTATTPAATTEAPAVKSSFATFTFDALKPKTVSPSEPVATTTTNAATTTSAPAPFSFGSPATNTPASNPFSFGGSTSANTESAPLAFKPSSFGASTTLATEQPATETPKFSFGAGTSTAAPLPTFSFGASAPATGGFSFNIPAVTAAAKATEQSGEEDEIPAEEAESFNLTRSNTEQLKTGAGEENETSLHEERCKIFMMDTTPGSSGGWIDLGVGIFKINRYNNETGKSRVLCRAEGSGKVILNTLVSVPGMDVSSMEGKKEVAMLAFGPEGKPTKYLIRVKTVEQAVSLKSALLSEIDYVKSHKNI